MATASIWSEREDGEIEFCVCNDKPTLVWMAQLAALELHPSLSRARHMERPTVLAFDLDPGEPANVIDCARVALRVRGLFGEPRRRVLSKDLGRQGTPGLRPAQRQDHLRDDEAVRARWPNCWSACTPTRSCRG